MTLGGMLKHLAYVEDLWFTAVVGGEPTPSRGRARTSRLTPTGSGPPPRRIPATSCAPCGPSGSTGPMPSWRPGSAKVKPRPRPSQAYSAWGGRGRGNLRFILVHMIEEYACHNGHADLLRQSLDGETGE